MENHIYSSAADYAYGRLRRDIILKRLEPGQRLSEAGLAEQLEVSRTPVREALRRLGAEGLVVLVPNSGVWVASPSLQEMVDTFDVREGLECMAVERAARHATPLQLCRLEECIEREDEYLWTLEQGATYGQGFFFGHPRPFQEAADILLKAPPLI